MAAMSASARASLELATLEMEAKATARKKVANLLQRPDQLDKVEGIRKRVSRKKASVEAMLKTAVQSQLDGVRTGMNQLQNAQQDIQGIKQKLAEIAEFYKTVEGLEGKLKEVAEENSRHSQLAAAVENLKHIFTVPETVKKCEEHINDGKLLHAHKCLTDLERSRDDLLFELHKQMTQSPTDTNEEPENSREVDTKCPQKTVNHYFSGVEKLSESLGKQLWLLLQRTLITLQRDPTIIVSVLRIIEREERVDAMMLKRFDQTGFLPPGRPKRWRHRAFGVLEQAVLSRIEGNQFEDRTIHKMWLVRHLEITRQIVIDDLNVIKTLCEPCFPPHYDIINKYVEMYHNSISQHLTDVIQQGLEGNEMVSLLTWTSDYLSADMMGSPTLKLDMSDYGPLLDTPTINKLQEDYLKTMRTNFQEWMGNSLTTDNGDWYRKQAPEADPQGYYLTSLPVILFQMIQQNLQVALTINDTLVQRAASLCMDELSYFIRTYKSQVQTYRDKHYENRSEPEYYLHYIIANINNCKTLGEFTEEIRRKHAVERSADEERFKVVTRMFHDLQSDLCDGLIEEVFLDLDSHIQELVTRKWLTSSLAVDTICVTLEDYCSDFVHLKPQYYDMVLEKARMQVATEYIKAMFTRKITFKNQQERKPAGEKIAKEADQLSRLFAKLANTETEGECPFQVLSALSEIIKLGDSSMLSLELAGFVHSYPDIRFDNLIELILMRGDVGRGDAKIIVTDCLGEDHDAKAKPKYTILSKLYS